MRLTIYTDYALRMLVYLSVNREGLSSVGDIAASYGISKNHLLKVAQELSAKKFIETVRGNGGGVRLARAPHLISVGDVVRATESDMFVVSCFDPAGTGCRIESACVLQSALKDAMDAFFRVLDRYTVADLMVSRPQLQRLLGIPVRTLAERKERA